MFGNIDARRIAGLVMAIVIFGGMMYGLSRCKVGDEQRASKTMHGG